MPKAQLTTKDGTRITVEGTHDEIVALIARLEGGGKGQKKQTATAKHPRRKSAARPTLTGLVAELIDGGFFKKPKELGSIKVALEEQGHFYPVTTLSPIMLRLVQRKELRRIKDKKRWLYVG